MNKIKSNPKTGSTVQTDVDLSKSPLRTGFARMLILKMPKIKVAAMKRMGRKTMKKILKRHNLMIVFCNFLPSLGILLDLSIFPSNKVYKF